MSSTLDTILASGIAYRNEDFGSSRGNIPTLLDMLEGEINDSQNEDIFDYIKKGWGLSFSTLADVVHFVEEKTNTSVNNLHALWVTSFEGVVGNYLTSPAITDNDITCYSITKLNPLLILSDLDDEGILLVTKNSKKSSSQN